jgi:endonuclease YncB( thermonuclease family)
MNMANILFDFDAVVTDIIDGDTAVCTVSTAFRENEAVHLRFEGINTPELHSTDPNVRARAQQAKDYLTQRILNKQIYFVASGEDKYAGRWDATVFLGDVNINQEMIDQGLGVPYLQRKDQADYWAKLKQLAAARLQLTGV